MRMWRWICRYPSNFLHLKFSKAARPRLFHQTSALLQGAGGDVKNSDIQHHSHVTHASYRMLDTHRLNVGQYRLFLIITTADKTNELRRLQMYTQLSLAELEFVVNIRGSSIHKRSAVTSSLPYAIFTNPWDWLKPKPEIASRRDRLVVFEHIQRDLTSRFLTVSTMLT